MKNSKDGPDGGYPRDNTAEGQNALLILASNPHRRFLNEKKAKTKDLTTLINWGFRLVDYHKKPEYRRRCTPRPNRLALASARRGQPVLRYCALASKWALALQRFAYSCCRSNAANLLSERSPSN